VETEIEKAVQDLIRGFFFPFLTPLKRGGYNRFKSSPEVDSFPFSGRFAYREVTVEIKIAEIPQEGLFFEIEETRGTLEWRGEFIPFVGPIKGWIRLQLAGERLLVKGEVHALLELSCGRCLETFHYGVDVEFMDEYLPMEVLEQEGDEVELSEEEVNLAFYGETISLEELYLEKIYLALPMKPLCSQGCKGLCPHCGTNLNLGSCRCSREELDPRWEALKALRDRLVKK